MVTYYVDPDSAAGGDGTSWANAYDTLSACEAARNTADGVGGGGGAYTDIVQYLCRSSSGTADTSNCYVNGGAQTSAYYLLIQAETGHRATAKWDATKYRIEVASGASMSCVAVNDDYVRVDGLQGRFTSVTDNYCNCFGVDYNITATNNRIDISNCLAFAPDQTTYTFSCFSVGDDDTNGSFFNCVAWEPYSTDFGFFGFVFSGNTYGYNCTASGGQFGFRAQSTAHTVYLKNCVAVGGYSGYVLNSGSLDKVNCASEDTSASATGTGITASNCIDNVPNTTATFVDPTNATILSRDWHIAGTGSDIYGAGVAPGGSDPLNYTTDIEGDTIGVGGRYDIGADYFYTAAGTTVFKTMLRRWR